MVTTRPIPDYGDVFTVSDFREAVAIGLFTNDDGSGYYATTTEVTNIPAIPSVIFKCGPTPGYSHVCWFNK